VLLHLLVMCQHQHHHGPATFIIIIIIITTTATTTNNNIIIFTGTRERGGVSILVDRQREREKERNEECSNVVPTMLPQSSYVQLVLVFLCKIFFGLPTWPKFCTCASFFGDPLRPSTE